MPARRFGNTHMKKLLSTILLLVTLAVPVRGQQTVAQIVNGSATFGGFSDQQLSAAMVYLAAGMAGIPVVASQIASNAAVFSGLSDRQLQEAQVYILNQLSGTTGPTNGQTASQVTNIVTANAIAKVNGTGSGTYLTNASIKHLVLPNELLVTTDIGNTPAPGSLIDFQFERQYATQTVAIVNSGAVIMGGHDNYNSGGDCILGGDSNKILPGCEAGSLAGGEGNELGAYNGLDLYLGSFIGAGSGNFNRGSYCFIGAGQGNLIQYQGASGGWNWSSIMGGANNNISNDLATITGGVSNYVSGAAATAIGNYLTNKIANSIRMGYGGFGSSLRDDGSYYHTNSFISGRFEIWNDLGTQLFTVDGGTGNATTFGGLTASGGNIVVGFGGFGFKGRISSGDVTNAAGSRVAYLSDVGGGTGSSNITDVAYTALVRNLEVGTNAQFDGGLKVTGGSPGLSVTNTMGSGGDHVDLGTNGTILFTGTITGNAYPLTNIQSGNIVSPTNAMANGVTVDFSKSDWTTNAAGNIALTGYSNINPTNYNWTIIHILANGADRTVTFASGARTQGSCIVTNGTVKDILCEMQPGTFTNFLYQSAW